MMYKKTHKDMRNRLWWCECSLGSEDSMRTNGVEEGEVRWLCILVFSKYIKEDPFYLMFALYVEEIYEPVCISFPFRYPLPM